MRSRNSAVSSAILYTFFIILALLMLYPLWYILMFSLSGPNVNALNHHFLWPQDFSLNTYKYVVKQPFLITGYKNSLFVTGVGTCVNMLLTIITAFPLSRKNMLGRKAFFSIMLFTMLFSGGMIPTYLVVKYTHLLNSLWALIIPSALSIYNMLIMMRFFSTIPESLIESAKIDGYNDISILFKIVLPSSTSVLATIGLFYAVSRWNEYFAGIIYINDVNKKVLQVVLRGMLNNDTLVGITDYSAEIATPHGLKMAAVILTILPIMCIYPFVQRYFVKGVMLGSVKE